MYIFNENVCLYFGFFLSWSLGIYINIYRERKVVREFWVPKLAGYFQNFIFIFLGLLLKRVPKKKI